MLRRMRLIVALVAAMTMLMVVAAPAMADDIDRKCFPFCDDRHHNGDRDFHEHDLFIEEVDEFFVELDDCEIISWDGDDAVVVCEVDFD